MTCYCKSKGDGSLSILVLNIMMDCLSFLMECLSSLLLPDIHLHLVVLSIYIILEPKNTHNLMIEILYQK